MIMIDEQIKQNADAYAMIVAESHIIDKRPAYVAAFNAFMSGAHSRDKEVERLKKKLLFAQKELSEFSKLYKKEE